MGVHFPHHSWRWITGRSIKHSRQKSLLCTILQFGVICITLFILCDNCIIQRVQSLDVKTESPVGNGFIKGFLGLNPSVSVSTSTLSSVLSKDDGFIPSGSSSSFSTESYVPKVVSSTHATSLNDKEAKNDSAKKGVSSSSTSTSPQPSPSISSAEVNRRRINQFVPNSLYNRSNGKRQIRDRARFLVGSLSRQNCFSKVICGLGARPPSTKTDLLNDYVYLMNELMVDEDEKSTEEEKGKKTKEKFRDDLSDGSKSKKKKRPYFKNDSEEEKDSITAPDDDYNPMLAQIADEELVADDPAILKFMQLEMKKRRPPPGYFVPGPPLRRYKRSVIENGTMSTVSPVVNHNMTVSNSSSTVPPHAAAFPEGRSARRKDRRQTNKERRRRFFRQPLHPVNPDQFISKRRLELRNEKDFKKRLNLAADAGQKLRNARQCRLLFDDCPLDDKQIDSIVVGLRRVMENNGNLAALVPPTTTLAPAVQAAVDAVKNSAATTKNVAGAPGSKVEIVLHLNQNGMPYGGQPGMYPQTAVVTTQGANGVSPYPPQYITPGVGLPQMPMMPYQTTTTVKPIDEENLLDFLVGVVNFNATTEVPQLDFDWSQVDITPLREKNKRPASGALNDYLENPLKVKSRDPIFDNSEEPQADLPPAEDDGEVVAMKDYLASLKETLLGLYQMANASGTVEADLLSKSSEESKESDSITQDTYEDDRDTVSDDDEYFSIVGDDKGEADESKEVLLKLKDPKEKRRRRKPQRKKKKKKGGSGRRRVTTTTERYEPSVGLELDKEDEKLFDDDDEENGPSPSRAPAKGKTRPRPTSRPHKKKKKPGKQVDDEDDVREVPQDQIPEEEEEDEEDEEVGDEEGEEEEGDEEDEEVEEDEEYEEDDEEGREKGSTKKKKVSSVTNAISSIFGGGPSLAASAHSKDPSKLTLFFAPSGSGTHEASIMGGDEISPEEKNKLAALSQVLLPTPAAPLPLGPKRPIKDLDVKPIVPAAQPLKTEFENVASFVDNTKIVHISDFDENSPSHPSFHKATKKIPKYKNPAAKRKKKPVRVTNQQTQPLGRPVVAAKPAAASGHPPYRIPPYRIPRPTAQPERPQSDTGGSGEGRSSEEEHEEEEKEDDDEEENEEGEEEDEDEDDAADDNESKAAEGDDDSHQQDEVKEPEDAEDEYEEDDDGDYGRHELPAGVGLKGLGRLPSKSRDDIQTETTDVSGEDNDKSPHKTLIAVPYFRQGTETKFVSGPPPNPMDSMTISNIGGSTFFGGIYRTKPGEEDTQDGPPHFRPYLAQAYPYSMGYRPADDSSTEVKSVEDDVSSAALRNHNTSHFGKPSKLMPDDTSSAAYDDEVPPKDFKAMLSVNTAAATAEANSTIEEPQDDLKKKKKKKDKKKKKKKEKKKKRKKKKKKKGGKHKGWGWGGNPSLLITGDNGVASVYQQLKNYLAGLGTVLYLPPLGKRKRKPPIVISNDEREAEAYHASKRPTFYSDDDNSYESKEKCKARSSRKKKNKNKKESRDDSCEEDSREEERKKGEERRENIALLNELIHGKPLIINPSGSPTETLSSTTMAMSTISTPTTTISPLLSPKPKNSNRYRITKRPRKPKPTIRPIIINTSFDGVNGNQSLFYKLPVNHSKPSNPPSSTANASTEESITNSPDPAETPSFSFSIKSTVKSPPEETFEGSIGEPILLFTTTTEKTTTPKQERTTMRNIVRPTRRRLKYKNALSRPQRKPMVGTVFASSFSERSTLKPLQIGGTSKEDDEKDRDITAGLSSGEIRDPHQPYMKKRHPVGAWIHDDQSPDLFGYLDFVDSVERQGRRPPENEQQRHDLRFPLHHQYRYSPSGSHQNSRQKPVASGSHVSSDGERFESESEMKKSTSTHGSSKSKRKKGTQRHKPRPNSHLPPPPPHLSGVSPSGPPTTGFQAIKNFNIRNLLSKFGNSLLDKTISYGRRRK